MNWRTTSILLVAVLAVLALAGAGCQKLKARDELNKGVQAFRGGAYPAAVEHFKSAVTLDPAYPVAREYLAMAYFMQYVPGAESPENNMLAQAAYDEFMKVLSTDPKNTVAIATLAQLFFSQKKLEEAQQWYQKLASIDPTNKTAFYTLGVIAWTKTFQPRMERRAELGMRPDDPGPIKDKKVRAELRATNLPIIEEGLQNLQKALAIDSQYDDAMAYMNLLYRERADLADNAEDYKRDTLEADNWVDKTLATKKARQEKEAPRK
ncbi:MAG: tetratricopeptide repeat protein [Bryobacteraceae bacterium]